jgi:hypothetical protein
MQRQVGHSTVEEMILRALVKAQLIDKGSYATPQRAGFQRTARTDKGVSAARQVGPRRLFLKTRGWAACAGRETRGRLNKGTSGDGRDSVRKEVRVDGRSKAALGQGHVAACGL